MTDLSVENLLALKKETQLKSLIVYADKITVDGAGASYLLSTVTKQGHI